MIRYKSITHERVEDAPFVGALVCAISCHIGCKGCFNQSLKSAPTKVQYISTLLDDIQNNPFNEGLILAGLEWSQQPRELIAILKEATFRKMPVIVYTGYSKDIFLKRVPRIVEFPDVFIKYGGYDETKLSLTHEAYGIRLASTNQNIETVSEILEHSYEVAI